MFMGVLSKVFFSITILNTIEMKTNSVWNEGISYLSRRQDFQFRLLNSTFRVYPRSQFRFYKRITLFCDQKHHKSHDKNVLKNILTTFLAYVSEDSENILKCRVHFENCAFFGITRPENWSKCLKTWLESSHVKKCMYMKIRRFFSYLIFTSERNERNSYSKSHMCRLDDIQAALKLFEI